MREFTQSTKLASVRYDVRGPILREAQHLEAEGHEIIKLNIGNTAPFGLHAPPALLADMARSLPESDGYSDSRGIVPAREAVADHYGDRGVSCALRGRRVDRQRCLRTDLHDPASLR